MVKKKSKKKLNKDTLIFIGVWIVILLSIGIMYLTMYNSTTNNITENERSNLASSNFKSVKTGDTNEGNIEIELTPNNPQNGKMVFDISLNTHSVEMEKFDLKQITKLEIDGEIFNPISAPSLSGHHNSGKIIFEIGKLNPKKFKILIEGMPSVNLREFNWS